MMDQYIIVSKSKDEAVKLINLITLRCEKEFKQSNTKIYSTPILNPVTLMYGVLVDRKYFDKFTVDEIKQSVIMDSTWYKWPKPSR